MTYVDFCKAIKLVIANPSRLQGTIKQRFLNELDKLVNIHGSDGPINMACTTLLFKRFVLHIINVNLTKRLTAVNEQCWQYYFGVPSVSFLLSYNNQINKIKEWFAAGPPKRYFNTFR